MASGDVWKLSVVGEGPQGQELVNVFYYKQSGDLIFDTPFEDLFQAWVATVQTPYLSTFESGSALHTIEVRSTTGPLSGSDFDVSGHPGGALSAGTRLPPAVSGVVTWRTALLGRSFRGRTYFWPIGSNQAVAGALTTTYQGQLATFADAAITIGDGIATAIYHLQVRSTQHNHAVRPTPVYTAVTDKTVQNITHLQRRRTQGVGA